MNTTKVNQTNEQNKGIDFSATLAKVMPRQNGTPEQFSALAASIERTKSYLAQQQQAFNDKHLPVKTKLSNTLVKEA